MDGALRAAAMGGAVAALLAACAPLPDKPAGRPAPRPALTCEPRALRAGDALTLKMALPHGRYLAVVAPGELWFFLVHPYPATGAHLLMPAQQFRQLAHLRLAVSTITATPWVHGRSGTEAVFSREGEYRILLGENLESHDLPVSSCTVRYRR